MPRSGDGVWTDIPNIIAVPGQTIESADWNNYRADLRDNEFNAARPITAGGTGATNATDALTNLGGVGQANFLGAFSIGDGFYSARDISSVDGTWLRRDGAIYDIADYPTLGALFPALPAGLVFSSLFAASAIVRGIGYGNGVVIAVGEGGLILTSTDNGANFTIQPSGVTDRLRAVAYGNGKFVIVGETSGGGSGVRLIADESDLSVWTASSATNPIQDIVFANTLFVTVSSGLDIETSNNGSSWTGRTSAITTGGLRSVTYGGGRFIIAGDGASSGRQIQTSVDGVSWTQTNFATTYVGFTSVNYANGNAIITTSTGGAIFSSNLTTWTSRAVASGSLNGATYIDGFWVVVGNAGTFYSQNQVSWSVNTNYPSLDIVAVGDTAYQAGFSPNQIIRSVVADSGQFQVPNDDPNYGWIKAEDA